MNHWRVIPPTTVPVSTDIDNISMPPFSSSVNTTGLAPDLASIQNVTTTPPNITTPITTPNSVATNTVINSLSFADVQISDKTVCMAFDSLNELDSSFKNSGDSNNYVEFKASCGNVSIKTYWINLNPSQKYTLTKYNPTTKQKITNYPATISTEIFNNKLTVYSIHQVADNTQGDFDTTNLKIWDPYTLEQNTPVQNITPISTLTDSSQQTIISNPTLQSTNLPTQTNDTAAKLNNTPAIPPSLIRTGSGEIFSVEMLIFAVCIATISFAYFKNKKKLNGGSF